MAEFQIKIPYSNDQLEAAKGSMVKKLTVNPRMIEDALEVLKTEIVSDDLSTEGCARFHGITTEALISSPNYEKLKFEHRQHCALSIVGAIKKIGLNDTEAWLVFLSSFAKR